LILGIYVKNDAGFQAEKTALIPVSKIKLNLRKGQNGIQ
jgi:hypothetical protein